MTMTLTLAPAATGWRTQAACRGHDPEIFFPVHAMRGSAAYRSEAAKRICAGCAVSRECLGWAIRHGEDWGIWGGLNELERRQLRADLRGHRRR